MKHTEIKIINSEIKKMIKQYDDERDKEKREIIEFEIVDLCQSLISSFVKQAVTRANDNQDLIALIKQGEINGNKGTEMAISQYYFHKGYDFLTLAVIYIYCAINVPNWEPTFEVDEYIWGAQRQKLRDILDILDPVVKTENFSYEELIIILHNIIPAEKIIEYLNRRPPMVDFDTKYDINLEQVTQAQSGDENAIRDLKEHHYNDIIESIIGIYKYKFKIENNDEELNKMREDGYQGIKAAINKLPSRDFAGHFEEEFWNSYIFSQVTWYIYFHMILTRINPTLKKEDVNDKFHTKQIGKIFTKLFPYEYITELWGKEETTNRDLRQRMRSWNIAIWDLDYELNPNRINWKEPGIDIEEQKVNQLIKGYIL